jgi:hypothetical protein
VSKRTGWERGLSVSARGKGLVGHTGAVLLRRCADQTGLTGAFSQALRRRGFAPGWDRGVVLVQLAVSIVLGATSMSDIAVLAHQAAVFGDPPSDSTVRRSLAELDPRMHDRIAKTRARIRAHVWGLIAVREDGFPWLSIVGRVLTGWIVIDLDATIIESASAKQGAAGTFKRTYGFHPLAGWCANTQECLAMMLREGNAGANTVADHLRVLGEAIAQIPAAHRAKLLIRIDGAGASHGLLEHLQALNTRRRTVRYTVGWKITDVDETAIAALPESDWTTALDQNGHVQHACHVAELTGPDTRLDGWPGGLRLIVRRARPSKRHLGKLTELEQRTGWRYQITATNIARLPTVPGSHHPFFLDVLHRGHAVVEDRVRTNKATGLRNLPSKHWEVNLGWVLACNIAADLDAWTRLLGLYEHQELAAAEPETLRHRLWHLPAKLATHARRRTLAISATWPWRQAFLDCWHRLNALPAPD